jgi:hypothetical protein
MVLKEKNKGTAVAQRGQMNKSNKKYGVHNRKTGTAHPNNFTRW